MIMINKGDGRFEDLTSLLMPSLPAGIRDASFADYDGDGVVDIGLEHQRGEHRFNTYIAAILEFQCHLMAGANILRLEMFGQRGDGCVRLGARQASADQQRHQGVAFFDRECAFDKFRRRRRDIDPIDRFEGERAWSIAFGISREIDGDAEGAGRNAEFMGRGRCEVCAVRQCRAQGRRHLDHPEGRQSPYHDEYGYRYTSHKQLAPQFCGRAARRLLRPIPAQAYFAPNSRQI